MKKPILQMIVLLTVALFASSAAADKIVIYNGHHGGHRGHKGYKHHNRGHQRGGHYGDQYAYREKHVYHHYDAPRYYAPHPRSHGYYSATPVIAGSIIGGVVGAELGHGGPLALGGALLGASIGRDIAYRHHNRRHYGH